MKLFRFQWSLKSRSEYKIIIVIEIYLIYGGNFFVCAAHGLKTK